MQYVILAIILLVIIGIIIGALLVGRKRFLSGSALQQIKHAWKKVEAIENPNLQIMEADKVLDHALKLLGYKGSLGEKLKQAGPRFNDLNAVWYAHKLRNTLAHEMNAQIFRTETEKAMRIFRRALGDLGMR